MQQDVSSARLAFCWLSYRCNIEAKSKQRHFVITYVNKYIFTACVNIILHCYTHFLRLDLGNTVSVELSVHTLMNLHAYVNPMCT